MTFRDPRLLWLLAAIPFAALFFFSRERVRERLARMFMSERLRGANTIRGIRPWLLTAGLGLGLLALAGPLRGFMTVPIVEREANRVVVLDVSNSMLATDMGTSRLSVAKALARRLMEEWPGRVALVEFEEVPEVVSPLTNDTEAVLYLLDSVQAGEVGKPGSDLGAALTAALRLVEAEPGAKADLVLISDGEDQGKTLDGVLARARNRGVVVSTILVGTPEGGMIPTPEGEPLKDDSGNVVKTQAHGEILQKIASRTGGTYIASATAESSIAPLQAKALVVTDKESKVRVPLDRYQWPLALAFVALLGASVVNRGAE